MPGVGPARQAYYMHAYIEENYDEEGQRVIYKIKSLADNILIHGDKGILPHYITGITLTLVFLYLFTDLIPKLIGFGELPELLALVIGLLGMVVGLISGYYLSRMYVRYRYGGKIKAGIANLRSQMQDPIMQKWLEEFRNFDKQTYQFVKEYIK